MYSHSRDMEKHIQNFQNDYKVNLSFFLRGFLIANDLVFYISLFQNCFKNYSSHQRQYGMNVSHLALQFLSQQLAIQRGLHKIHTDVQYLTNVTLSHARRLVCSRTLLRTRYLEISAPHTGKILFCKILEPGTFLILIC